MTDETLCDQIKSIMISMTLDAIRGSYQVDKVIKSYKEGNKLLVQFEAHGTIRQVEARINYLKYSLIVDHKLIVQLDTLQALKELNTYYLIDIINNHNRPP